MVANNRSMFQKVSGYIRAFSSYAKVGGFTGLYYLIKGKISGSPMVLSVNRQDIKFPLDLRVPSSDIKSYRQVFLKQQYGFSYKGQPQVIVDAGANIGLVSILFANKYPNAKIIAIEPENSNFEMLKMGALPIC